MCFILTSPFLMLGRCFPADDGCIGLRVLSHDAGYEIAEVRLPLRTFSPSRSFRASHLLVKQCITFSLTS